MDARAAQPPRKMIIDTDGGIDDLMALALGLRSPEIEILAVTTVCGNVSVDRAIANIQLLFHFMQKQPGGDKLRFPPILALGAPQPLQRLLNTAEYFHGKDGVGGITTLKDEATGTLVYMPPPKGTFEPHHQPAVDVILDLLKTHAEGEITILTIGPLTNIALAAEADIQTLRRAKDIVMMGGAFFQPKGNVVPHAEYNIYADPEAAKVVCESGLPLVFVPLDATHCVPFTQDNLLPWIEKSELAKFVTHLTAQAYNRKDLFHLHDPVALIVAIDEEQRMTTRNRFGQVVIDCSPEMSGNTIARSEETPSKDTKHYIDIVLEVNFQSVLSFFVSRVLHP